MEQNLLIYNRPICYKRKGSEKNLNIKAITMIDPVTRRFKITKYDDKIVISIVNLV